MGAHHTPRAQYPYARTRQGIVQSKTKGFILKSNITTMGAESCSTLGTEVLYDASHIEFGIWNAGSAQKNAARPRIRNVAFSQEMIPMACTGTHALKPEL